MVVSNQGWYNRNEGRNFPFADDASLADTGTGSRLPNGLIVDMVLVVPVTIDPATVYISEVAGFGSGLVISFSADGTGLIGVATVPSTHERYDGYTINASGAGDGISGRITLGQTEVLAQLTDQRFQFDLAAGALASIAVRPRLGGLASLTIEDFAGTLYPLTSDITLVAGNNLVLSTNGVDELTLDADGGIVIDDRFSGNTDDSGRTPIKTINGVTPDGDGNLDLVGTSCLSIIAGVSRLTLDDTCAEPCCGCEELERVQEGFSNIGDSQGELNAFLNTLESQINNLQANFDRSNIPQV